MSTYLELSGTSRVGRRRRRRNPGREEEAQTSYKCFSRVGHRRRPEPRTRPAFGGWALLTRGRLSVVMEKKVMKTRHLLVWLQLHQTGGHLKAILDCHRQNGSIGHALTSSASASASCRSRRTWSSAFFLPANRSGPFPDSSICRYHSRISTNATRVSQCR